MEKIEHKMWFFTSEFECRVCHKRFLIYYVNKKGYSCYGDKGRYNFRGAKANFNRHIKKCELK